MTSRAAAAMAAAVLALLGGTYYFTHEPAFQVTIRWREGATWDRRLDIEHQFGLVRGRNQEQRALTYDLVDTRRDNIAALLRQAEVEDGGVLDRRTFTVPPDAPYGTGWMWAGSRIPALRANRLVPVIAGLCVLALAGWARQEIRARRMSALRLVACRVGSRRVAVEDGGQRMTDGRGVSP